MIAARTQPMQQMPAVIIQRKSAVRQTEHAVLMRALTGQQSRAAGRASWSGVEGLPEQKSFASELLQIGRGYGVSVGLNVPAGIVRVQVENIGTRRSRRLGTARQH